MAEASHAPQARHKKLGEGESMSKVQAKAVQDLTLQGRGSPCARGQIKSNWSDWQSGLAGATGLPDFCRS